MVEESLDQKFDSLNNGLAEVQGTLAEVKKGQSLLATSISSQLSSLNEKLDSLQESSTTRSVREHKEVTERLSAIEKAIIDGP